MTACTRCGRPTTAKCGRCTSCRYYPYETPYTPADALTGGRWVLDPVRRVLVWQEEQAS